MVQIRLVTSDEMKEAVALADAVFRNSGDISMGTAFPKIFSSGLIHSFGAFERGELVAFMGLVPNVIRVGASQLQVYSLGAVCTAPEHRGKGHASLLLNEVFQFIRQAGASLLLVSGDRSLYTRSGCVKFGSFRHYSLRSDDAAMMPNEFIDRRIRFRLFQETDWFQFYQLTQNKTARYDENLFDLAQATASESYASAFQSKHAVYVAEMDGKLLAAVIMAIPAARGSGTEPFVVAWYGIAGLSVALAQHMMREFALSRVRLPASWHETDLHQALEGCSFDESPNAGTVKIIDYLKLWQQILPYLQAKDAAAAEAVCLIQSGHDPELVCLSVWGRLVPLAHHEFVGLLFNPGANIPSLEPYRSVLDRLFPIAFPYTAGLQFI